ncbi:MAG: hypothetical protein AAB363_07530, partial [Planctomycetota bacterium]
MRETSGKSIPPPPVLGKWGKDRSLRWQIELIAGRTRDLANRIKRVLVAVPPRQRLKGKMQNTNDINWGGRPGAKVIEVLQDQSESAG